MFYGFWGFKCFWDDILLTASMASSCTVFATKSVCRIMTDLLATIFSNQGLPSSQLVDGSAWIATMEPVHLRRN